MPKRHTFYLVLGGLLLGISFFLWSLQPNAPESLDKKMMALAGSESLNCGTAEVWMGDKKDKHCLTLPGLRGGDAVKSCTVKALKTKIPFHSQFKYRNNPFTSYGICSNGRGALYFIAAFNSAPLEVWLLNKGPKLRVYRCSNPIVQVEGGKEEIICPTRADCSVKFPGG